MKIKKFIKTIALLVCTLTIVSAPTYAYAAILPVCIANEPSVVGYEYQPDPLIVQPGVQEYLLNWAQDNNGAFLIPANKTPYFIVYCNTIDPFLISVYMNNPSYTLVYQTVITAGSTSFQLPAVVYDRTLSLHITPYSSKPISVSSYWYGYF